MKKSLGLLEVQGLTVAMESADAMIKTAQVNIEGMEKTNGFGWMLVKVSGDVSSVNAAIETGKRIALQKDRFVAAKVISRPVEELFLPMEEPPKEPVEEAKEEVLEEQIPQNPEADVYAHTDEQPEAD